MLKSPTTTTPILPSPSPSNPKSNQSNFTSYQLLPLPSNLSESFPPIITTPLSHTSYEDPLRVKPYEALSSLPDLEPEAFMDLSYLEKSSTGPDASLPLPPPSYQGADALEDLSSFTNRWPHLSPSLNPLDDVITEEWFETASHPHLQSYPLLSLPSPLPMDPIDAVAETEGCFETTSYPHLQTNPPLSLPSPLPIDAVAEAEGWFETTSHPHLQTNPPPFIPSLPLITPIDAITEEGFETASHPYLQTNPSYQQPPPNSLSLQPLGNAHLDHPKAFLTPGGYADSLSRNLLAPSRMPRASFIEQQTPFPNQQNLSSIPLKSNLPFSTLLNSDPEISKHKAILSQTSLSPSENPNTLIDKILKKASEEVSFQTVLLEFIKSSCSSLEESLSIQHALSRYKELTNIYLCSIDDFLIQNLLTKMNIDKKLKAFPLKKILLKILELYPKKTNLTERIQKLTFLKSPSYSNDQIALYIIHFYRNLKKSRGVILWSLHTSFDLINPINATWDQINFTDFTWRALKKTYPISKNMMILLIDSVCQAYDSKYIFPAKTSQSFTLKRIEQNLMEIKGERAFKQMQVYARTVNSKIWIPYLEKIITDNALNHPFYKMKSLEELHSILLQKREFKIKCYPCHQRKSLALEMPTYISSFPSTASVSYALNLYKKELHTNNPIYSKLWDIIDKSDCSMLEIQNITDQIINQWLQIKTNILHLTQFDLKCFIQFIIRKLSNDPEIAEKLSELTILKLDSKNQIIIPKSLVKDDFFSQVILSKPENLIQLILQVHQSPSLPLFRLQWALQTGASAEEILKLMWSEIDLDRYIWQSKRTGTTYPITKVMLIILIESTLTMNTNTYIFPSFSNLTNTAKIGVLRDPFLKIPQWNFETTMEFKNSLTDRQKIAWEKLLNRIIFEHSFMKKYSETSKENLKTILLRQLEQRIAPIKLK